MHESSHWPGCVNSLIPHRAKSLSLPKVKTDAIDAYHLCEMFYKEELEPYKKRGIQLLDLGTLPFKCSLFFISSHLIC